MAETAPGRVLVVGSLNADLTVRTKRLPGPGETVTGSDLVTAAGGKSSNQAAAAALLGADVTIVGRVGADAHGAFLRKRLVDAGVDVSQVADVAGVATGTAVIAVDEHGENMIIVSPGANAHLCPADVRSVAGVFDGAVVLCLCLEVEQETVLEAARAATERDVRVLFNPSPYAAVNRHLLELTTVLIVNVHELADLVGPDQVGQGAEPDWAAVLGSLQGVGPPHVVVTRGAGGAAVIDVSRQRVEHVPSPQVTAVDTTGCGDAFLGSLATRLAAGDEMVAAVRFAVRVGAFAATRPGAQASYPTLEELRTSGL